MISPMTRLPRRSLFRLAAASLGLVGAAACSTELPLQFTNAGDLALPAPSPLPPPFSLFDGVFLADDEAGSVTARRPVAVMVDNLAYGARPQVGLDQADLVYELLVEGGITRFMAVYLRQEPDIVEPVRSVRTPFLYLASELGAIVAHDGAAELEGDADAGRQMYEWGVPHINQEQFKALFTRDRARWAPHNLVTSVAAIRAEAKKYDVEGPSPAPSWRFKEDHAAMNAAAGPARRVSFAFAWGGRPLADFTVEWRHDPAANSYQRWSAGRPHTDGRSGKPLTAKNVVVQFDHAGVADRHGHVLYGSLGEGPAHVFLDGLAIEATWSKPSREERTRYHDTAGAEVQFNRGATWVAVLPYESPLSWG
jgi:hypothetical protein